MGILVSRHVALITLVLDFVTSTSEMLKTIDVHAMYLAIREVIAVQMHCHSVFVSHIEYKIIIIIRRIGGTLY